MAKSIRSVCPVFVFSMLLAFALEAFAADKEGAKSADEIARELANPNNSLTSLTFKNQFCWYQGDLPGAGKQSNYTLLFQPVFPFGLEPPSGGGKANLFIRPAFPLLIDQPVPESKAGGVEYNGVTALGDIGYGVTGQNGLLWAVGTVGTLPTATDNDVGGDQWQLGLELLVAKFESWGLYGLFPSYQWNIAGSSDEDFSISQLQLFLKFLLGGGWNTGSVPIMNYDWKANDATIPLNLAVGRTVKAGNTPIKLEVEINYYIEQPDAFGPEWMIGLNITPVVPNIVEGWIKRR
jgi:hypothetical protein